MEAGATVCEERRRRDGTVGVGEQSVVDSVLGVDGARGARGRDIGPLRRRCEREPERRRWVASGGGAMIGDCCQFDDRLNARVHLLHGCLEARADVASSMPARGTASHSMSLNSSAETNVTLIRPLAPGPMLAASRSRSAIAALPTRLLSASRAQTFLLVSKLNVE